MSSLLGKTVTPKQTEIGSLIPEKDGKIGSVVNETWSNLRKGEEVLVSWETGNLQICLTRCLEVVE